MSERIQKLLSTLGYGSRREIEEWVVDGRLTVNGATAEIGQKIAEEDAVKLDGKRLSLKTGNEPMRVLLYKKRTGEMVTREDPEGRRTVFRKLPDLETGRWIAIGRLDVNTSGLLLMTNHGELARRLMHPSFEQQREYAVRALGEVTDAAFASLRKGVTLEDGEAHFNSIRFGDNEAELDTSEEDGEDGPQGRANHWFIVTISEGRHREVRRLFESQGLTVNRLIRTGYGPIKLGRGIKSGSYREATADEITKLLEAVNLPNNERLPERVRASHQTTSEYSRSGPNAMPNPKKKPGNAEGWVKASKDERKQVERDERRVERYGEAAVDKGPKAKRSFSSTGPRKPGAASGERPYKSKETGGSQPGSWTKRPPAPASESSDGQFKARGFGAASVRSYSERGDGAPSSRRPSFENTGEGKPRSSPRSEGGPYGARPRAEEGSKAWGEKPRYKPRAEAGGERSGSSAWGDKPRFKPRAEGEGGSAYKPRREDEAPSFKPRAKPYAAESSSPRTGRESVAAPVWKKAATERPAREGSERPAYAKKPYAPREGAPTGDRPRYKPKAEGEAPRRYGEGKPAYARPQGDKPAFARRDAAPKKPGQKFVVKGGKAVGKLGLKRKPERED